MFKYISSVIVALILSVSLLMANPASAGFEELEPGLILMEGTLYMDEFGEFYKMTMDPKIRHYKILIHSPGGAAMTTIAVMNRIFEMKSRGITFETETYGFCSSAGSFLFLMGDKRTAHAETVFMWHTMQMAMGQWKWETLPDNVRAFLKSLDDRVVQLFRDVTGASEEVVQTLFYNKKIDAYYITASKMDALSVIAVTHFVDNKKATVKVSAPKISRRDNH